MNNGFNKRLLAIAIPAVLAANVNATDLNLSQTKVKLASQAIDTTQFIIKYKNNLVVMSDQTVSNNKKAQNFVQGFKSNKAVKTQYVRSMAIQDHHVVRVNRKMTASETQSYMHEMIESGQVEFIEIDQMLKPFATPNDPQYSSQWHYFESNGGLNLPTAWDSATGSGVTVAVLDTGYRPHADLNANLLPGYDMISNVSAANDGGGRDADARDTGDAVTKNECGTNDASNSSWHGTHVAGTIAAVTNNGEGVAGVAYNAKIVPVRVLGKCGGSTSDIADGIIWASGGAVSGLPTNTNPADVINMSLGGEGSCSSVTQSAINTARANGAVIVIAAGNSNDNSANYNPGNCSGIVNVAAVGRNGGRAYYSNYGTTIDVAAPGGAQSFANDSEGVLSTHNSGSNGPSSDSYHYSQGTSMAAPHVAGVAALIKQVKPNATPDEIESILKTTTRSFPATCSNCGTGIVDAAAAVAAAGAGTTPPTGDNVLIDGEAKTGLSGAQISEIFYTIEVPSGATNITFAMSGGSGDADLYVRAGAKPTSSTYDCRPYEGGNVETCSIDNPTAGTYHVMLKGYSAYSGVSLKADITGGSTGGSPQAGGGTVNDIAAAAGNWAHYTLDVPAGMASLTVTSSGGSGDADLFVKFGSRATTSSYDCRPYKNGNAETCTFSNPQAGTWHLSLNAYRTFNGVTLDAQYKP
ncbi:peptidase S8 [Pseudoalteromonas sp. NBT06-2]|uniref:S8 family serine peptidase n=1 Tax=Pseudoalteromonas sp. NBT06-2 TaxID=2025950 RepID=UPI000BA77A96|nr:S8 family serine peptidase [Pseudoalteromonas sp. NBT06-2]PAJ73430.1 peptidase S8 [Pseudoalteromonas sp. NBT06-2]